MGGMKQTPMLSKPDYGWSDFTLGDKSFSLSYLTDIPNDWPDAAIDGLQTGQRFIVSGTEEPNRVYCLVSRSSCRIICDERFINVCFPSELTEDEFHCLEKLKGVTLYEYPDVEMLAFCENLYRDISQHEELWAEWYDTGDPAALAQNREDIRTKLALLQSLIQRAHTT